MITTNDIVQMHRELRMPRTATGVAGLFVKMTRMGCSIPETAAIAGMTVERIKLVIAGKEDITIAEHNSLLTAFGIYLWWNGYRLKQSWTFKPEEIRTIYAQSQIYWDELCRHLKTDLEKAIATING
tara:strand:+ start:4553 stop:4933 length:381 start_codon:yes stop_codon:yes gene_type:complete